MLDKGDWAERCSTNPGIGDKSLCTFQSAICADRGELLHYKVKASIRLISWFKSVSCSLEHLTRRKIWDLQRNRLDHQICYIQMESRWSLLSSDGVQQPISDSSAIKKKESHVLEQAAKFNEIGRHVVTLHICSHLLTERTPRTRLWQCSTSLFSLASMSSAINQAFINSICNLFCIPHPHTTCLKATNQHMPNQTFYKSYGTLLTTMHKQCTDFL